MNTPTLRDRFAMAALATMAFPTDYPECEKVADYAYRIADAMLERREKNPDANGVNGAV